MKMRTVAILVILLIAGTVLWAQPKATKDPVTLYWEKPTAEACQAAARYLDSLIVVNPKNYRSQVSLLAVRRNDLDQRIDVLYGQRDSLDDGSKFGLANLLLGLKDCPRAIVLYEQLNDGTPKWSCPWRHKGQALYELHRLDEAERSLLKAIETRQSHYDAYVWLARVQKDLKRYDEALATLKRGLGYKFKDIESPDRELANDEDIRLLDDLLVLNQLPPDQVETERNKIIRSSQGKR